MVSWSGLGFAALPRILSKGDSEVQQRVLALKTLKSLETPSVRGVLGSGRGTAEGEAINHSLFLLSPPHSSDGQFPPVLIIYLFSFILSQAWPSSTSQSSTSEFWGNFFWE